MLHPVHVPRLAYILIISASLRVVVHGVVAHGVVAHGVVAHGVVAHGLGLFASTRRLKY